MKASEAKDILKAVKKWLKQEVKQDTNATDGTEGICIGRQECAECLLEHIKYLEDLHDAKRAQKIDDDSWRA